MSIKKKHFIYLFFLLSYNLNYTQEKEITNNKSNYITLDYFNGNFLKRPETEHLSTSYPKTFLLGWNIRSKGDKQWEKDYNYPDKGYTFGYLNLKNDNLGKLYAFYKHYNFHLLNRNLKNKLILNTGFGFAYITNPYHKTSNNKNILIGSHINASSLLRLIYQRENIFKNIGIQTGITFIHASNGSFKKPNLGINTWAINLGINYSLDNNIIEYPDKTYETNKKYTEPIHYNIAISTGFNESFAIGSQIKPFVIFNLFADKRLSRKSGIQLGFEYDMHFSFKNYIKHKYVFDGEVDRTSYPDWKRITTYAGYELFFNKTSLYTQLGFYLKSPKILGDVFYERIGLKRYFTTSFFTSVSLKAHIISAESFEFGIGYRF